MSKADGPEKEPEKEIEMCVVGLVLDPASNAPIVILKDVAGEGCLPIWIGLAEATAIASVLKRVEVPRPMTHDLMRNLIDEMGGRVVKIHISGLKENTFFATIEVAVGERLCLVDSRPSDAIALAVRVSAPIMVNSAVLAQAQVTLVAVPQGDEEGGVMVGGEIPVESETAGDFSHIERERWAEILAQMAPDDFKYKM